MRSNLEEVISQYLTMPTNYAVLINGERGTGKTFSIKNSISKLITNTKVYDDQSINYRFLYISLYGINSLDEIYTMMALELYPILKSKDIQVGIGISKIILRGFFNIIKAGNIDDYLADATDVAKTSIDTKNFVFVFDDIDRKSANVDINNLIGFINSLVEHDNNKVILVADNGYITDENYKQVKEKTIGAIIDYEPSLDQIYDEISKGYADRGFGEYHQYLQYFKSTILECFNAKRSKNLRIITYLFEHLFVVFGEIFDNLKLDQEVNVNEFNLTKFENTIKFATAISIEFRLGNISFKERRQLGDKSDYDLLMSKETMKMLFESTATNEAPKNKENKAPTYFEVFLDTYFPQHGYHYYPSIYNFFTGGTAFNKILIFSEWKGFYDDKKRVEEPQYTLYNNLYLTNCFNLSNEELKQQTRKLLNYALQGKFTLDIYLSVYWYLERFNGILKYDMQNVANKLVLALEKHKNSFSYVPMLSHQFNIEEDRPLYKQYRLIFDKAVQVNKNVEISSRQSKQEFLFNLFIENPQKFYEEIQKNSFNGALFNNWNINKLYKYLKKIQPKELWDFGAFLLGIKTALRDSDKDFIRLLITKINSIKTKQNLRGYVLDKFKVTLDEVQSAPSYY